MLLNYIFLTLNYVQKCFRIATKQQESKLNWGSLISLTYLNVLFCSWLRSLELVTVTLGKV